MLHHFRHNITYLSKFKQSTVKEGKEIGYKKGRKGRGWRKRREKGNERVAKGRLRNGGNGREGVYGRK